jgi:2-polyprenyl-3-methyl-5-hydroxy-6-metoxy-1,4-benzoquinol methylase
MPLKNPINPKNPGSGFNKRSNQPELLDRDDIPFEDIRRNMQELDFINTWLGGHNITLAGIKALSGRRERLVVCEIGCGGGDNLAAIGRWARRKKKEISFIGIDINPNCIAVAKERLSTEDAKLVVSDYRDVELEEPPDIIFSSLFCHHFTNEELVKQLQWMQRQSRVGFFINDLHRHPIAYYSIKWLTAVFSKSYLVKNDAPLSVLRGFSRSEWLQLLNSAGIVNFSLRWKWAFRWLAVGQSLLLWISH